MGLGGQVGGDRRIAGAAAVGVATGVAVGAAAGSAATPAAYAQRPVAYAAIPAGCAYRPMLQRYDCGGMWLAPAYGANGLYYAVVPAP